jgi:hypothetical protein
MAKKVTKTRVEEELVDDADADGTGAPAGEPLTAAILVITTLCLVIAIAVSWWQLGRDYKSGLFGG